jgi:hypothetical protein
MRAIAFDSYGDESVLNLWERPEPKVGHVHALKQQVIGPNLDRPQRPVHSR